MTYQFKIQIKGITKPPVWREIMVPADFTFEQLHTVIQIAFGWGDCHLFEFVDRVYQSNIRIAIPSEDDFELFVKIQDASKIALSKFFPKKVSKLLYLYDFGDNWVHEITLKAVIDEKRKNAYCVSGKGTCPPEDCGGIYGYEEMKNIFKTKPASEEADEYRDWLGLDEDEIWDPASFDIEKVNDRLKEDVCNG